MGNRPDADLLEMEPVEALAELTRRHADAVYRVALSVMKSHEQAEDVAQDTLLKAWQALPTFRSDAPLKNWLLRITHNTAISALRRRRDVHVDPMEMPEAPEPAYRSVESRVEARVSIDAFEDALQQLDELSRAVVVLREVEGLSYEEISQVLDVGLPTVKTRLLRARRLLATSLEGGEAMKWFHPSARKLQRWLDEGGPEDVDAHVATCARCANRLEDLAAPLPELSAALSQSLQAPEDLVQRLGARMTESMRSREDLQIILELMGIPLSTVRNLMTEEE